MSAVWYWADAGVCLTSRGCDGCKFIRTGWVFVKQQRRANELQYICTPETFEDSFYTLLEREAEGNPIFPPHVAENSLTSFVNSLRSEKFP